MCRRASRRYLLRPGHLYSAVSFSSGCGEEKRRAVRVDFSEGVAVENGVPLPVADCDARVVLVEVAALRGGGSVRAMGVGEGTNEQVWMALGKAGHGRGGRGVKMCEWRNGCLVVRHGK